MTPEALARIYIDQLLQAAGWQVHDLKHANIHATTGVADREFPLNSGHGEGFGSSEFHVLRPSDKVHAKYLNYFVSSQAFRKEASGHMTGAVGLPRVPAAFLADAQLPLVNLEEQRRIVAEIEKQFSRLDEAVADLKRYKASILKAAVEGRLVETEASIAQREGTSYETGEQLLQRILEERRGIWVGKGKYKEPLAVSLGGLPAVPRGTTDNAINATEILANCELRYLEIVFLTANLNSVAAGSGQPFVNQTILNDTLVPLPPNAEQTRIVAEVDRHLSIVREVEFEVDTNLKRAQALLHSVLNKNFGVIGIDR